MKQILIPDTADISEEYTLIKEVTRWTFLAIIVGIIVGILVGLFLLALEWVITKIYVYHYYFLGLPIILIIVSWGERNLWKLHNITSTDRVIRSIHHNLNIGWQSITKSFIFPLITISFGGATGKEAPAADMGAGIGSLIARVFKLSETDHKKLMICGVSAGFSAAFGTPLAGAIFGTEVLFVGNIWYEVLLPSIISGIVAFHISSLLGVEFFRPPIFVHPVFSEQFFLFVIFGGIVFGIISFLVVETYNELGILYRRWKAPHAIKAFFSGLALIMIGVILSRDYLGLGFEQVKHILIIGGVPLLAFYFKTLAMALTVHGGGSGGLVTPLFFIGASAGSAFAHLFGLDQATFAAIGMISVLAGATNTPIASSVLGVELFGMELGTYATVSALIAFLLTGHRSLFPSQKMTIIKAKGIKIQKGETIGKTYVKGTVMHREELLISRIYRQVKKLYLSKVKKRS